MMINNIPYEIWQIIFNNLSILELCNIKQTCKNFYNICNSNFFKKNYKYQEFLIQINNWEKTDKYILNGSNSIDNTYNNRKLYNLALCLKYNDLNLFNEIFKKIRKTKNLKINWVELYNYVGQGGNINVINFINKKCKLGRSHIYNLSVGALLNNNINVINYLNMNISDYKNIIKNRNNLLLAKDIIQPLLLNNNVKQYHYVINFFEMNDRSILYHCVYDRNFYIKLIKQRCLEALNILYNLNYHCYLTKNINLLKYINYNDISWCIESGLLKKTPQNMNKLIEKLDIYTVLELIDNNIITYNNINWERYIYIIDIKNNNFDEVFNRIYKYISEDFNWNYYLREILTKYRKCNKSIQLKIINLLEIITNKKTISYKYLFNHMIEHNIGLYLVYEYLKNKL